MNMELRMAIYFERDFGYNEFYRYQNFPKWLVTWTQLYSIFKGCRPCRRPRFSGPAFPPLVGNKSLATL